MLALVIGSEAFQIPDGHGLSFFGKNAPLFTLGLLGTHSAANGRKTVFPPNATNGLGEISLFYQHDKIRDFNRYRTPAHAGWTLALKAPLSLS